MFRPSQNSWRSLHRDMLPLGFPLLRVGVRGVAPRCPPAAGWLRPAALLAWQPGLWLGSAADVIAAGRRALADTPTALASLPGGNQTPLLPPPAAHSGSGGAAWPQVPPRRGHACSGGSLLHPSVPWGAGDQRQGCLEARGLDQLLGCAADPLLLLGELRRVRPPSLPQFPYLQGLCRPLFL